MKPRKSDTSTALDWPHIPFPEWEDTCSTLHLWIQIAGKVRLTLAPWLNHSWHAVFYPTARGLTSSPIPYPGGDFQIDFDFLSHELLLARSTGQERRLALRPQTVAEFYREFMTNLAQLGIDLKINRMPNEIPDPIPFDEDRVHGSYEPDAAQRFWRALLSTHRVFTEFRSGFLGKVSPVHFFWGSFDLAVTRFSGRKAPLHPGGTPGLPDEVVREAYSHEVSSAGFWPGNGGLGYPAFYSYAYPEPEGYSAAPVRPDSASYNKDLKLFLLPYDSVRETPDPEAMLLDFLETTYRAAAESGRWDREALECPRGRPGIPRPLDLEIDS
jgi:hypothetical protein